MLNWLTEFWSREKNINRSILTGCSFVLELHSPCRCTWEPDGWAQPPRWCTRECGLHACTSLQSHSPALRCCWDRGRCLQRGEPIRYPNAKHAENPYTVYSDWHQLFRPFPSPLEGKRTSVDQEKHMTWFTIKAAFRIYATSKDGKVFPGPSLQGSSSLLSPSVQFCCIYNRLR